jgi:hypothetical protein
MHDWFYSPKQDELYHYDDGVFEAYPSDGTSAFFTHHTLKVLAPDVKEKALRPVLGMITSDQFQQMFKYAREKTSSDSRTLNYSIWKCIALSDFISTFAAVLLSSPQFTIHLRIC